VINLGNIAGLHAHNHELHAHCSRCARWATLPLAWTGVQLAGIAERTVTQLAASEPRRLRSVVRFTTCPRGDSASAFR